MRTSPVSLLAQPPRGSPRNERQGSRHPWVGSGTFPRFPAAARGATKRRAEKPWVTIWFPCPAQIVSTRRLRPRGLQHPAETRHKLCNHLLLPGEQRAHHLLV